MLRDLNLLSATTKNKTKKKKEKNASLTREDQLMLQEASDWAKRIRDLVGLFAPKIFINGHVGQMKYLEGSGCIFFWFTKSGDSLHKMTKSHERLRKRTAL